MIESTITGFEATVHRQVLHICVQLIHSCQEPAEVILGTFQNLVLHLQIPTHPSTTTQEQKISHSMRSMDQSVAQLHQVVSKKEISHSMRLIDQSCNHINHSMIQTERRAEGIRRAPSIHPSIEICIPGEELQTVSTQTLQLSRCCQCFHALS